MIDVEVAKTFLKVADTGSFQEAARELNVTQSTVSARIRTLEARLGRKVFERDRFGARLNAHGEAFQRYAQTIVQAWEEGRRIAALGSRPTARLRIGGEHNLWTRLLAMWLLELRAAFPDTAITAVAGDSDSLVRRIKDGDLDLAVVHAEPGEAGVDTLHLMDDELILVTTDEGGRFEDRYVDIKWRADGVPGFELPRDLIDRTRTSIDLGFASINYLMTAQAAGYLPRRLVAPYLDAGHLFLAKGAPAFRNPVYVLRRPAPAEPAWDKAIAKLRDLAGLASRGELPPPFWSQVV